MKEQKQDFNAYIPRENNLGTYLPTQKYKHLQPEVTQPPYKSKYEKFPEKEDSLYSISSKQSHLRSQVKDQEEGKSVYDRSLREVQKSAEEGLEKQVKNLEAEKVDLIKRQANLNLNMQVKLGAS